jgi:hypothetical protein
VSVVKVAFGNWPTASVRLTTASRWLTLKPATWSTLRRVVRSTPMLIETAWSAPGWPVTDSAPVTPELRATASWLELWPANCSETRYPACEPAPTAQAPERPAVGVATAAEVVGVGDGRASARGALRRPEK